VLSNGNNVGSNGIIPAGGQVHPIQTEGDTDI